MICSSETYFELNFEFETYTNHLYNLKRKFSLFVFVCLFQFICWVRLFSTAWLANFIKFHKLINNTLDIRIYLFSFHVCSNEFMIFLILNITKYSFIQGCLIIIITLFTCLEEGKSTFSSLVRDIIFSQICQYSCYKDGHEKFKQQNFIQDIPVYSISLIFKTLLTLVIFNNLFMMTTEISIGPPEC